MTKRVYNFEYQNIHLNHATEMHTHHYINIKVPPSLYQNKSPSSSLEWFLTLELGGWRGTIKQGYPRAMQWAMRQSWEGKDTGIQGTCSPPTQSGSSSSPILPAKTCIWRLPRRYSKLHPRSMSTTTNDCTQTDTDKYKHPPDVHSPPLEMDTNLLVPQKPVNYHGTLWKYIKYRTALFQYLVKLVR